MEHKGVFIPLEAMYRGSGAMRVELGGTFQKIDMSPESLAKEAAAHAKGEDYFRNWSTLSATENCINPARSAEIMESCGAACYTLEQV
ncbi:MAG: hypothetical protein ACOYK9_03190 [Chlamydiia bacterium]